MWLPVNSRLGISLLCLLLATPSALSKPHSSSLSIRDLGLQLINDIQEGSFDEVIVGDDGQQDWQGQEEEEDSSPQADVIRGAISDVMTCKRVPGLSVSVVQAGRIILQDGLGAADVLKESAMQEHSKVCIGSCTKAFVSTLLGILLAENQRSFPWQWDTRLVEVLGTDFRLGDELRTQEATVRDVLAHRLGYPVYGTAWLVGLDPQHSIQDYCSRLWTLKANREFRSGFSYSNFMYVLAACVAERLGGAHFDVLLKEKILDPLGMDETALVSEMVGVEELPRAYIYNGSLGVLQELDSVLLRTVSPADASGGLCTTAKDMTKWLQFQLAGGRMRSGKQLMWQNKFDDMHEAQVHVKSDDVPVVKPYFPETDLQTAYGLGWTLGTYRGYRYSRHGGTISGFSSLVTVYKDAELAIFTSMNGPMYDEDTNKVIHYYISDIMLGLDPWLDEQTACTFPLPWSFNVPQETSIALRFLKRTRVDEKAAHRRKEQERKRKRTEKALLKHQHKKYEGEYGHLLFGNLTVAYNHHSATLQMWFGNIGFGTLVYVTDTIWSLDLKGPLEHVVQLNPVQERSLLILFLNDQGNKFQFIKFLGLEPKAPPMFQRDLLWTDVDNQSS